MRLKLPAFLGFTVLSFLVLAQYQYGSGQASPPTFPYPEGYRLWTHVKSMELKPGHPLYESFGGLHHIYVNQTGLKTYLEGKKDPFPKGTVIVFDLLEAKEEGNALLEGPRKLIGVMVKDPDRYRATGGWGYYAFGPDKKPLSIDPTSCHACHQGAANTDFVFSAFRP
ncbi:cytochrome P460 family protein [Thermus tengchongensis]|uniref:cytochrome P460 family protein n=1 Tax=Thermus tengchongensis TaxID=1214928 RepID=UPI001F1655F5|nr:cytochrome P460 family protein [Thermus tengchongensis]